MGAEIVYLSLKIEVNIFARYVMFINVEQIQIHHLFYTTWLWVFKINMSLIKKIHCIDQFWRHMPRFTLTGQ